jgi:hypothetical protein
MMVKTLSLPWLLLIILAGCKSAAKNDIVTTKVDSMIQTISKIDSASESTMLNPKYENGKIYGFGIFKIGQSVENSIGQLLSKDRYRLDSVSTMKQKMEFDFKHELAEEHYILKIKTPASTLNEVDQLDHSNWCKDVGVYLIYKYKIDSLDISNLYVSYYKNELVNVSCEWTVDLKNAISSKYGNPDDEQRDLNQKPIYYSISWRNKDVIVDYNTTFGYAQVEIKGGNRFLNGCNERSFKSQNEVNKAEKKEKLKNF